jgi:DNA replication protein DnaD
MKCLVMPKIHLVRFHVPYKLFGISTSADLLTWQRQVELIFGSEFTCHVVDLLQVQEHLNLKQGNKYTLQQIQTRFKIPQVPYYVYFESKDVDVDIVNILNLEDVNKIHAHTPYLHCTALRKQHDKCIHCKQ